MTVKITINGDGLSLERETNLQKAGQIITFLGLDDNTSATSGTAQVPTPIGVLSSQHGSLKEAINESKAKTNAQKIAVIVNYFLGKEGAEGVLVKEILLQLTKMGERPGNFARDMRTTGDSGYIYSTDPKKTVYGITEKGKEAILNQFSEEVVIKPKSKKKGVFKKAVLPRDEVNSLTIITDMEGYPGFHSLPTKADCILWVLAYADSKDIEDLTPREVELITDKLKKKIPQKDFSAHNKKNVKSSFVSSTDGKYKLQQKGIDHLKGLDVKKTDVKAS